ncbi:MAG TPA: anthranilate phosphoribosyltransferase [Chthoniobacterales bacterium]|nr:anthranilate phosphoribosyltransferase [Chthoniobacterales bacterium]
MTGAIAESDSALRRATLRLIRREDLDRADAEQFLAALLDPRATDAQIAAALVALAAKGETAEELAGMAAAMRARAIPIRSRYGRFIDTAGTGSSAVKTFNVSTAAAFVIAGAGLPVAKHGSRAATSRCGSADLLEILGVNTAASPEVVERCLNEHGICFIFAPRFHQATARVAQVRRELGVHTTFNLLGPLTNPARPPFQVIGVWHRSLVEPVASALAFLGARNAWVVHGADGLDDVTLAGETFVAACRGSGTRTKSFTIGPEDFGVTPRCLDEMRATGPADCAELVRAILGGEKSHDLAAARDLVIVNAAAALHVGGVAHDLREAAAKARDSIDDGCALAKLDALVRETNQK